jgi:hypothetical protein
MPRLTPARTSTRHTERKHNHIDLSGAGPTTLTDPLRRGHPSLASYPSSGHPTQHSKNIGFLLVKRRPYSGVQGVATNQPPRRTPQSLPEHSTRAASTWHSGPPRQCPTGPHPVSAPIPATARHADPPAHHRQLPRLVGFAGTWLVPGPARPAQLYSCAIQQRG